MPVAFIITSSILSARGPASSCDNGIPMVAMKALVAKTLPCFSGGTLDCQMDWLEPLVRAMVDMKMNMPAAQWR